MMSSESIYASPRYCKVEELSSTVSPAEKDLKDGKYVFEYVRSQMTRFYADFDIKDPMTSAEFTALRVQANQVFKELCQPSSGYVYTDGSYDNDHGRKLSFHVINKNIMIHKPSFSWDCDYGKLMLEELTDGFLRETTVDGKTIYPRAIFKRSADNDVYGNKDCFRLPLATYEDRQTPKNNKPFPHVPKVNTGDISDYFITVCSGARHPLMDKRIREYTAEEDKKKSVQQDREMKVAQNPEYEEKKATDEEKKKIEAMLELVKKERFCGREEWRRLLSLLRGNGLSLDLFQKVSKESGYAYYNADDCAREWYNFKSKEICRFPTLQTWLEEDGVDWKSMFCRKKQGMVQDLLKAWREFGTLTDMSIAEIFFKHYSDSLYYTDAGWLHYTEKNGWEMGNPDSIVYPLMKFIGGGLSTYVASLKPEEDEDEKKFDKKKAALMKECVGLCSYSKCAKVIKTCQGLFKNNDVLAEFDQLPHWFCFSDFKAIDMKTGDVVDVKKEHKILTTCGYPLPERDEKEVERAKEFVLTIVEEKVFDSYMSMLACSFYGDPNLNQKVFIHTGSGGNGKSLMTILLQETLGNYAGILPIEQLTKDARSKDDANSSLAAMRGKRYAQLVEPEDDRDTTLKVAKVKELTGESKIKVRSLFKESIDMFISFTLNIFCNEKPKLSKFDGGIERRLGVFPYEFRFVDEPDTEDPYQKLKDPELGGTIKRDKSFQHGFLYLCLDHWRKNNGIFISNDSVKEANKVYMRENNKVVSWLEQNYKPSNGKDFVRVKEVFANYSSEPSNEKITMTSFTTFISSLGYKTVEDKSNGRKVYLQKIIRCEECSQDVDVCECGDRKKFSAGMKQ
jgi:P4 family phage/plasmid primase-like protien